MEVLLAIKLVQGHPTFNNLKETVEISLTGQEFQLPRGRPVGYVQAQPRTTWNKSSCWSERDLRLGSPDFKSGALITQPHGLPDI